jgi:hypothetical protein
MSSTLGASLLRTVLSDGTLKILGSGLDKGPIILSRQTKLAKETRFMSDNIIQFNEQVIKTELKERLRA